MTRRMVRAASGGQADVLGHCTGRLVEGNRGTRPESKFDAEKVFTACRDHGTAVEINSRPERRDPPTRLLKLALEIGCDFSIDTDAHAPGQLDFLGYGAQRALDNGVPVERIVNTWPVEKLLEWTDRAGPQSGSIGISRPGIAAQQHAAHDRSVAEALPHLVHGRVEGQHVGDEAVRPATFVQRRRTATPAAGRRPCRCWTPRNPPGSDPVRRSADPPRPPARGRRRGWRRWTPSRAAWCVSGSPFRSRRTAAAAPRSCRSGPPCASGG